jgi:hypothetical protein
VTATRQLSSESVRFRAALIRTLWDDDCFGYIDADRFLGTCPICGGAIGVSFHGHAPRATLNCHGGCTEGEVAARLELSVRP